MAENEKLKRKEPEPGLLEEMDLLEKLEMLKMMRDLRLLEEEQRAKDTGKEEAKEKR